MYVDVRIYTHLSDIARCKVATFACEPTTGMDLGQSESGASMRRSEAKQSVGN